MANVKVIKIHVLRSWRPKDSKKPFTLVAEIKGHGMVLYPACEMHANESDAWRDQGPLVRQLVEHGYDISSLS